MLLDGLRLTHAKKVYLLAGLRYHLKLIGLLWYWCKVVFVLASEG